MTGYFKNNRQAIQKAIFESGFIKTLSVDKLIIEEKKAQSGKLKTLKIEGLPRCSPSCVWLIDLEDEKTAFAAPVGFKKAEKGLLIYWNKKLHFITLEMKEHLHPSGHESGLNSIKEKIQDSICRFSFLLSYFIFEDEFYSEISIDFHSLIVYNNDLSKSNTDNSTDISDILDGKKEELLISDLGGNDKIVKVFFIENTGSNEEACINLLDYLEDLGTKSDGSFFNFPLI